MKSSDCTYIYSTKMLPRFYAKLRSFLKIPEHLFYIKSFNNWLWFTCKGTMILGFFYHCVKNVQIRSYFWSVFSCIRTEYRKCGPEINPYLDIFHALYMQKDKINYPASIIWEANLHLLSKIGAIEKSFNSINSRTAVNRQFL